MTFDLSILQDIGNYDNIAVLTGAGISAESGIATFRGKDGLWSRFRPEELASVQAFLANPERVWDWYQHRRNVLAEAQPNAGHVALAEWEKAAPQFTLITQNVDGLHRLAGSQHVLELHGNIRINRCQMCGLESSDESVTFTRHVPLCKFCGGMLRPGVVWFGESLPEHELEEAFRATEYCDLFVTIGTSAQVYPAASLPEMARARGATVIEVNTEETAFTSLATNHLRGTAGTILPELVAAYRQARELRSESESAGE
jgi:NAD-dependent deacetylase